MNRKLWLVSPIDKELASDIADEFDIDPFAALLLVSRGITDDEEIFRFFSEECNLCNPYDLMDVDKAVDRIIDAMQKGEKIAIYGDYDADGITATALLYSFFRDEGCDVIAYIPDRNTEGYGLNMGAVKTLHDRGVGLIITVDNGISAYREAEYIKELGMDLIITDHHKAAEKIPDAVAVVNPHRHDCPSEFKLWCGAGVAFKLVCAITEDEEGCLEKYSDLVTLGTIGDIVSLTGENREIVKHGLRKITADTSVGIKALKQVSSVDGKQVNATSVAFSLVPRLNAVGRMAHASEAFELLISEDPQKVTALSERVDSLNHERQELEKHITDEAEEIIRQNPDMLCRRVLIFTGKDWHGGVIGIVAARLTQKYGKPCFVITDDGENAKGSARSLEGFSLYDAISSAADLLTHYGGHVLAAGFSLKSENLPAFEKALYAYAKNTEMPFPTVQLDCRLKPEFISSDVLTVISSLEPFGAGNPQPIFGLYGMELTAIQPIGSGKHLRLNIKKGESNLQALLFGTTAAKFPYVVGDKVDLAVKLERNEYMGQVRVSIYVKDIRMSGTDDEKYLKSVRLYEKIKIGERVTSAAARFALVTREQVAAVYRYIKKCGSWSHGTDVLCYRLGGDGSNACKVLVCIDVLTELGIFKKDGDTVTLADESKKVNLEDSRLLSHIRKLAAE